MALERFKINSSGAKAILRSKGVQRDLERRANKVKAAAEAQLTDLDDWEVIADVQVGRTRAGALISGVPTNVEADRRILGSALDSA